VDDDGFFLFKVVRGDFSAVVHIVTPYNPANYNTAGLQARAFSTGGNAFGGSENYVSWTRFDEFGFPNYLRNEVNGGVTQINPGGSPNSAYWLRMDRVGNNFSFYQRTNGADPWTLVTFPAPVSGTVLARADLAGQPLQVGIMHATFNNQIGVQFSDFSITATNFDSYAPPPPATGLTLSNGANSASISWIPDAASSGSVVVLSSGFSPAKEAPINGTICTGNPAFGAGDLLLSTNSYATSTPGRAPTSP
jgi:regulation of enolase protein 1 (concanavalin A-like superfamily)